MDEKTLYYYTKATHYGNVAKECISNPNWAYYYAKLAGHWANNAIFWIESR